MKIAFIVNTFPKLSETFVLNQITGMLDLGHEIEIFAFYNSNENKIHPDIKKYKLMKRVHYLNMPCNNTKRILKAILLIITNCYKNPLKILKSLNLFKYNTEALTLRLFYTQIHFLNKTYDKFDIILCHFGQNGIIGTYLKKIGIDGKIITTFHGYDMSGFISNNNNIYKNLFLEGDLFLPISNYWGKKLVELNCDEKKIVVHHMGIPLDKFKYSKRILHPNEEIKILTIGRLTEKKGHKYAIKAIAKLIHKHKNLTYQIAGDGPLKEELKGLVKKLGIGNHIKFFGSVDDDTILRLYRESHIFILPSITACNGDCEGIPVVLMEAQATGLPTVSTFHSGIPEIIINGKSGFLVPEQDVNALVNKIDILIENPEIWSKMSKCGRKFIEKEYDIKILNQKLVQICQKLIE